ncbi:MAG: hypothetical protein NZV14_09060 [Bryobacteraceae bacterium]|nr:hypothetical protein [Bryobacteraceae bacterium]MDW8378299.1 hypothetical protein [Bryobacterales bacterium]
MSVKRSNVVVAATSLAYLLTAVVAFGQRNTGDWMTAAFDPQRSSWVRSDGKISPASMSKPGFELVWKVKLNSEPRQLQNTTAPALFDFYIGYRGFRSLGFFGSSQDRVIALDTDLARLEWEQSFSSSVPSPGTIPCPGGMTSTVTRPTVASYPMPFAPRGGRGTPAKSGVGLPHEGAITLRALAEARPAPPPKPAAPAKPGTPSDSPFAPRVQWVMALTGDGKLHSLWVSNGHEPEPPVSFLPPGAHAVGLIVLDGTAYAATIHGCSGVDDGVWAMDLATKKVTRWKATGKLAGSAGPAFGPDGMVYVATSNELAVLAPKSLAPLKSFTLSGAGFRSSPLVFEHKAKDWLAVASADGRLHVFDPAQLDKGPVASSPVYSAPEYATGTVSSWQDSAGQRWILVPAAGDAALGAGFRPAHGEIRDGAIVAWKLVERNGSWAFEPGWVSTNMISPHPPVIVNGVVFALSSGEFRTSDPAILLSERLRRSRPAVLYALDATTGKTLWSSGNAIHSFVHSGGLSAGGGRVYVATHDGTQYAFGFPMEH